MTLCTLKVEKESLSILGVGVQSKIGAWDDFLFSIGLQSTSLTFLKKCSQIVLCQGDNKISFVLDIDDQYTSYAFEPNNTQAACLNLKS